MRVEVERFERGPHETMTALRVRRRERDAIGCDAIAERRFVRRVNALASKVVSPTVVRAHERLFRARCAARHELGCTVTARVSKCAHAVVVSAHENH